MAEQTSGVRRGCLTGVGCVGILVTLYILYNLAMIVIPLTLGFLFPWEAPRSGESPDEAIIRIIAPEGAPYYIEWGSGFSNPTEPGEVDPNLGYRDHPVDPAAVEDDHFDITVRAGLENDDTYSPGDDDVSLGAVLFVAGETVECKGGSGTLFIDWRPDDGAGGAVKRMTCGSHRWAPV